MTDMTDSDIKALLQIKILSALKNAPEAIDAMVASALNKPVNLSGRHEGYGTKIPYLEYITGEVIREEARKAVIEVVEELKPQIKNEVRERLSSDTIIDSFCSALIGATKDAWRINVKFKKEND